MIYNVFGGMLNLAQLQLQLSAYSVVKREGRLSATSKP